MTRFTRFCFLLTVAPFAVLAQQYVETYHLSASSTQVAEIYEIDKQGNAYLVFGKSPSTAIRKLSSKGQALWTKDLSNNGFWNIFYLRTDGSGNIYISGIGSRIVLDDGRLLKTGNFLIKMNQDGKIQWAIDCDDNGYITRLSGGPVAFSEDKGLYWSANYYGKVEIQGHELSSADGTSKTSNTFVAYIDTSGQVRSLFQEPSSASRVQLMVEAENGNAALVMSTGEITRTKLILNNECKEVSRTPFISYGDIPPHIQTTPSGYRMLSYHFNGNQQLGYWDVRFDRNLEIINARKLQDPAPQGRTIYDGIGYLQGYFLNSPVNPYSTDLQYDWIYLDADLKPTILPDENMQSTGRDPFTRTFLKVTGDTLHMMVQHYDSSTLSFKFQGQNYSNPEPGTFDCFWVKYVLQQPDSCHMLQAKVLEQGLEGNRDISIRFSLPENCRASRDIQLRLSLNQPELNHNDLSIPDTVILSKGQSEWTIQIPVLNDQVMEPTENFHLGIAVLPDFSAGAEIYHMQTSTSLVLTVSDDDNTVENRCFYVTPSTDVLKEGSEIRFQFRLKAPLSIDRPITISVRSDNTFPSVLSSQGTTTVYADSLGEYLISYPEDLLISRNKAFHLFLSASDNVLGGFRFVWKEKTVGQLDLTTEDNDQAYAKISVIPESLRIPEGENIRVSLILEEGRILEEPLQLSVSWSGPNSNQDDRLGPISQSLSFPALQNNFNVEIATLDNKKIDIFNNYQLNWSLPGSTDITASPFSFSNSQTEIELIDDDFSTLKIPSAFSPNGDGMNDEWKIPEIQSDTECRVSVFNRYGELVFSSRGYQQPWNGQSAHTAAPVGTYFYKIAAKGIIFSGSVTLLR